MRRIASTARPATSKSPTRDKLPGSRRKAAPARIIRASKKKHRLSNERQSIASRLREETAAHRLEVDLSQQDAAARLDELSARLVEQSLSISHKLRTQLRRLSVQPVETPLRGLYLWGGVGRGKTMLMDWFYDSLPPQLGERTHFYRFMRQIHAELRRIKSRADPLDTVAERLAARVHVLCLDEFFVADIADAMIL